MCHDDHLGQVDPPRSPSFVRRNAGRAMQQNVGARSFGVILLAVIEFWDSVRRPAASG
jgi:hypothetical protein